MLSRPGVSGGSRRGQGATLHAGYALINVDIITIGKSASLMDKSTINVPRSRAILVSRLKKHKVMGYDGDTI